MWIWSKKSRHSSIAANRLKQIQQRWWKTLPHGSGLFWRMAQTFLALLCFCHRYLGSFWNDFYNVWQLLNWKLLVIGEESWLHWKNSKATLNSLELFHLTFIAMSSCQTRGPHTLHTKLHKIQLSSLHTTTFCHNCSNFFNSFINGQQFLQRFFRRIFAVLCVVV